MRMKKKTLILQIKGQLWLLMLVKMPIKLEIS